MFVRMNRFLLYVCVVPRNGFVLAMRSKQKSGKNDMHADECRSLKIQSPNMVKLFFCALRNIRKLLLCACLESEIVSLQP
jgi:hypothetical protein